MTKPASLEEILSDMEEDLDFEIRRFESMPKAYRTAEETEIQIQVKNEKRLIKALRLAMEKIEAIWPFDPDADLPIALTIRTAEILAFENEVKSILTGGKGE